MHLEAFAVWWAAPIAMAIVSVVYFATAPRDSRAGERVLVSSHGLVAALLYVAAIAIWSSGESRIGWGLPFALAQIVPVVLIVVAFLKFRGPRAVHMLQLVNLLAMVWAYFMGVMAITGEWL